MYDILNLKEVHIMNQYLVVIELTGMKERCYRKVVVDADLTMYELHLVIQTAMGWNNAHLYEFVLPNDMKIVGFFEGDSSTMEIDAASVQIRDVYNKTKNLRYIYDFGDWWNHDIVISEIVEQYDNSATVIEAEGVCPPEDVGGVSGYEYLNNTLIAGDEEEINSILEWLAMIEYSPTDTTNVTRMNEKLREILNNTKSNHKIIH